MRHSSTESETTQMQQQLPTSKRLQERLVRRQPELDDSQRLLKVAIIGAPNAGKSTLLNKLIGWKVAPVSQKVHTTRYKTLGVLTEDEKQVVFLDTPGIIVPGKLKRHKLEPSLLIDPHMAMFNADIVIVLVDVTHVWHQSRLDPEILKLLQLHTNTPSVLVLNKIDQIKKKEKLLSIVKKLTDGVVGKNVNWSTDKAPRDVADIFRKMTHGTRHADTVASSHGLYSLQESCDLLQSSYDNLHDDDDDDDDDESDSVETRIIDNDGDVASRMPNSDTATSDVKDDGAMSDGNADDCSDDWNDSFRVHNGVDLYSPDVWESYYSRLHEIGRAMKDREGWPNFDNVFMISAVDGDGVADIKNYLLDKTYPSGWEYSSSVVTDQNPVKLAKLIVQERLLDHLPDEIPYSIQVKLSLWTVEDNYLRASFDIVCSENRQMRLVLRHIRAIAAEAKQELMNAFRREMTLQLVAVSRDKSETTDFKRLQRPKKSSRQQQTSRSNVSDVEY